MKSRPTVYAGMTKFDHNKMSIDDGKLPSELANSLGLKIEDLKNSSSLSKGNKGSYMID
jgi:hypothetical protein